MSTPTRGPRVLSLDGGGMRGLSEILILEEIMTEIQKNYKLETRPEPQDYFDLICGTSTGGLIAVLLGRLGKTLEECKKFFLEGGPDIFRAGSLEKWSKLALKGSRHSVKNLTKVLQDVAGNHALYVPEQSSHSTADITAAQRNEEEVGTRRKTPTFVVAVADGPSTTHLFRSYGVQGQQDRCSIVDACLATSAASTYFPPKEINGMSYVDGGFGNNNPVKALVDELESNNWHSRLENSVAEMGCLVSLGTGYPTYGFDNTKKTNALKTFKDVKKICTRIALDCHQTHVDMERRFNKSRRGHVYHRFDVDMSLRDVSMDDASEEALKHIRSVTKDYLQRKQNDIQKCAVQLHSSYESSEPKPLSPHVQDILQALGSDAETGTRWNEYPLHTAVAARSVPLVEYFCRQKADTNQKDASGLTPLQIAVAMRDEPMVETLIAHKADPNVANVDNGMRLVHSAVAARSRSMVRLLSKYIGVEEKSHWPGHSPLIEAVAIDSVDMVEALINAGFAVNATDAQGKHPVHVAVSIGSSAMVQCLRRHGVDIDREDRDGQTPLHSAIARGFAGLVAVLAQCGANVNQPNQYGQSPLHLALSMVGNESAVRPNYSGVAACPSTDIVRALVRAGAHVNRQGPDGQCPLHVAVSKRNLALVVLLLESEAEANCRNSTAQVPLHLAVLGREKAIVEALLGQDGVDVNCEDTVGLRPLHLIPSGREKEMRKMLEAKGAKLTKTERARQLTPGCR